MFVACELGLVREELQQLIWQSWSQGSLNFSAPASKEIPEKGRLGPTLSPIPFPLTLQLSTRPLCALHVKEKPEVKDEAFKSVVTSWNVERALVCGS